MMYGLQFILPIYLYITTVRAYNYIEKGDYCQTTKGENGVCIHFGECESAIQEVKDRGYPEICSFEGLFPIVCCPNVDLTEFLTPQGLSRTGTNNDSGSLSQRIQDGVVNREGSSGTTSLPFDEGNLSLWKCREYGSKGKQNDSKVVGEMSESKRYAHVALLGYVQTIDENKIIRWKCAGSLISEKFVLTSARCAKPQSIGTLKYVQLGRFDLNSSARDAELQDFTVKETYTHPNFHYLSIYNDIGLIELSKPVRFTEYINPVCLATNQNINNALLETVGYGLIQSANKLSANRMKYGSGVNCKEIYDTSSKGGNITNEFICAEGTLNEAGNCNADIGGPLQRTNTDYEFGSFTEIVGIYLFGSLCEKSGDIFVNVFPYVSWIEQIVWPNS